MNNNQSNSKKNQVVPYSFVKSVVIVISATLLDIPFAIVLLISSEIFAYIGHKRIAFALKVANVVTPDPIPILDELFTLRKIIKTTITVKKNAGKACTIFQALKKGISIYLNT